MVAGMNRLDAKARAQILHLLCEGQSIRAITRLTGASKNTVIKLLVDAGQAAVWYQDRTLRNLPCTDIQADEIWGFVGSKQANTPHDKQHVQGDVWVWIATCRITKLVPCWYVGHRSGHARGRSCRTWLAALAVSPTEQRCLFSVCAGR